MTLEVVVAGVVLVAVVGVGTLAHEGTHVLALWALGASCELVVFPDRAKASAPGRLGGTLPGRWATVTPTGGLDRLSPWQLRVAALAPLALLAPFGPVVFGVLPDPFAVNPIAVAATVGWAACALPSPQDFALVWYPDRALAVHRD
jgi:hypothetical protein